MWIAMSLCGSACSAQRVRWRAPLSTRDSAQALSRAPDGRRGNRRTRDLDARDAGMTSLERLKAQTTPIEYWRKTGSSLEVSARADQLAVRREPGCAARVLLTCGDRPGPRGHFNTDDGTLLSAVRHVGVGRYR